MYLTEEIFLNKIENNLRVCHNIRKIAIGQGDDYTTTGCLIDYCYFKNYHEIIATNVSKQQKLVPDPKSILEINFTGNLGWGGMKQMFFTIKNTTETVLDFSKGAVKVLWFYFVLI